MQDSLEDLDRRRQALQRSVDQLERRQIRIQEEMKGTFSGSSQDIAIRVQSFKDYLTGSLEDLVLAAQKLDIGRPEPELVPATPSIVAPIDDTLEDPQFARSVDEQQTEKIRAVVRIFRTEPDYYGPVWKFRRTFESIHADRINDWFFTQGGRGSLKSLGFLLLQSALLRLQYTSTNLDVYRSGKIIRSFPYSEWSHWEIFWQPIPILFYFREVNSIHFLPILFDPKMLRVLLEQRCPQLPTEL